MRNGMAFATGSIALTLMLGANALGQFESGDAPPQAQPSQSNPVEAQANPVEAQATQANLVATVNGEPITRAEFQGQVQATLQARQQQNNGQQQQPTPQEVQRIQQQVLDSLVQARLVEQYVRKEGPDVKEQEIDNVIRGYQQTLQKQGVTLDEYLASNKQTMADLRKRVEGSLAWQKYQQEEVTPENLREFYQDNQQRFGDASFEQVRPQVSQLYTNTLWSDIIQEMKPKAKVQVVQPKGAQPRRTPSRQPNAPGQ